MAKLKKKDTKKTLATSASAAADAAVPLQTEEALPVHLQLKFILQKKAQNPEGALSELKAFRPRKTLATTPLKMLGHPSTAPLAHFIFTYGNGGWSEGVEYIVSLHKKYGTLTQPNANGEQIIHILAQSPLYYERIQQLLDAGIDINTPDINGKTPLHYAVAAGNIKGIRFLFGKKANRQAVTPEGATLLHSAARFGNEEIMELLLEDFSVETPDMKGKTPLHYAAAVSNRAAIEFLLTKGASLKSVDAEGMLPLHEAARSGDSVTLEFLLAFGTDINIPDAKGRTPLHHAAAAGNAPVVRFLLEKGALFNAVDSAGELPLHSAARSGNKEIIGLLLERDPNAYKTQNTKLQTPVHLSLHYAKGEVMEYLSTAEQRARFFAKQWAQYDAAKAVKKKERTPEQAELVKNFHAVIVDEFKKHHQKIQWKLGEDSEGHTIIHSAILNSGLSTQQFEALYEERQAAFRVTPKGRDLAKEYAEFAKLNGRKAIVEFINNTIIPRRDNAKAQELEEKKLHEKLAKKAAEKAEKAQSSSGVELEVSEQLAAPVVSGTPTRKQRADTVVERDTITEIPVHRKRSGTLVEGASPSSSKGSVNKSPSSSDDSASPTKKSNILVRGFRKASSNFFGTPPKPAQGDKVPLLSGEIVLRTQSGTNLNLPSAKKKVSEKASRHKTDKLLTPRATPSAPNTNRSPKRRSSTEELSFQEMLAESGSSSDEEKSQGRG